MIATAVGIAASSTLGHQSSAGSVLRPFVMGKAAANGVAAALLARQGFTASPGALDSPRGLGAALVQRPAVFSTVTSGLGTEWLLDEVTTVTTAHGGSAGKARNVLRDQRHDGVAEFLVTFLPAIDEQPDVRALMTATCG
jgi:2-methylcitrate dehydratase PrpD